MGLDRIDVGKELAEIRLSQPERAKLLAETRRPPDHWSQQPLVILAADHPARGSLSAGDNPWAMANRADLLVRLARLLMQPVVDGLLASPDIMEELLLLNAVVGSYGGPDFMDRKVLIGSINRGGIVNSAWELDDFVTGYTPNGIQAMHLDGAKMLMKLDFQALASARTLQYCATTVERLNALNIPVFLEPLSVPQDPDLLIKLVGIASALGSTSMRRWLKVPMVDRFQDVAAATTCPLLLLGGNDPGDAHQLTASIARCMASGPQVRGVMMGRGILYPAGRGDPLDTLWEVSHVVRGTRGGRGERVIWDHL